ncbi:hypothetical protein D770_11555 [Flammeovirgaceae bacterium 311]|nr:hypothetical protein D770_11555 [Flammeovirgaceae bacterium 311]
MNYQAIQLDISQIGDVLLSSLIIYVCLIIFSRIVGPRSFSQMTAFDFAVTVALGAIVGATATGAATLHNGIISLAGLFLLRWLVAHFRRYGLTKVVDNFPIMLMDGSKILPEYLKRANITEADLLQNLRKNGITRLDQVQAVVMERDGSISVLKSGVPLDTYLLKGVKGHPATGKIHVEPPLNKN